MRPVLFREQHGFQQPQRSLAVATDRLGVVKGELEISFSGLGQGWYLDVIDFTNPSAPVVRDPVSIPGQLARSFRSVA